MLSQSQRGYGRSKPPPSAQIDWSHPLARELVMSELLQPHDNFRNYARKTPSLTKNSTVTPGVGRFGAAATFGGGNLSLTNTNMNVGAINFSVAVWVKMAADTGGYNFASKENVLGSGNAAWDMQSSNFGGIRVFLVSVTGTVYRLTGVSIFGDWKMLAFVHDNTNSLLTRWVNQVSVSSALTAPAGTGAGPFRLGARPDGGDTFAGLMENFFFWKRALTTDELLWLYREPFAMFQQTVRRTYFSPLAGGWSVIGSGIIVPAGAPFGRGVIVPNQSVLPN